MNTDHTTACAVRQRCAQRTRRHSKDRVLCLRIPTNRCRGNCQARQRASTSSMCNEGTKNSRRASTCAHAHLAVRASSTGQQGTPAIVRGWRGCTDNMRTALATNQPTNTRAHAAADQRSCCNNAPCWHALRPTRLRAAQKASLCGDGVPLSSQPPAPLARCRCRRCCRSRRWRHPAGTPGWQRG